MPYVRTRAGLHGMGDFSDQSQCSQIPLGDKYRKPGNYCATPDGGITTFNADGSTYRAPGAVDPDPAHPAGADTGSILGKIGGMLSNVLGNRPVLATSLPQPDTGMATTTKLVLAGGALLAVALIARR